MIGPNTQQIGRVRLSSTTRNGRTTRSSRSREWGQRSAMQRTWYRSDSDELQRLTGKRVERWSCITVALRLRESYLPTPFLVCLSMSILPFSFPLFLSLSFFICMIGRQSMHAALSLFTYLTYSGVFDLGILSTYINLSCSFGSLGTGSERKKIYAVSVSVLSLTANELGNPECMSC